MAKANLFAITPPALRPGDTIAITATARKVTAVELAPAIAFCETKGYRVITGKNVYAVENQFAGSDKTRATDLNALLANPEVKAILFARGGYGTTRILECIDWELLRKHPKWLVGFSDITAIHAAALKVGVASIHGPLALSFLAGLVDELCLNSLFKLLSNDKGPCFELATKQEFGHRYGIASGPVIGGNLSLLVHLIDTPTEFDYDGAILFLEDIDEHLYHIDRMLVQLKRSGRLAGLAGLIVGGFTDMKDNSVPFGKNYKGIIADAVADYRYPVCFDFPVGHQFENYPLIQGKMGILAVGVGSVVLDCR